MNWLKRRRARARLLEAARGVAVSYTPECQIRYDPDDLEELRRAAIALYELEGERGAVLTSQHAS